MCSNLEGTLVEVRVLVCVCACVGYDNYEEERNTLTILVREERGRGGRGLKAAIIRRAGGR